jgi:hypothetical protein
MRALMTMHADFCVVLRAFCLRVDLFLVIYKCVSVVLVSVDSIVVLLA